MRHLPLVLAASLSLALAPASLSAQELIAVDFLGNAHGVDAITGQPRLIGPTGVSSCNAMALHNGVLYAGARASVLGAFQLATIDPITAHATVQFANLGVDLRGLCSNEGTNELFGIANLATDRLVRIDVTTGVVTTVGSTGLSGIQALDAGGSAGFVFGWDVNVGLVRIDTTTGLATDVNPSLGTQGATIQFLTSVPTNNGLLFFGGNSALYAVDRLTGVVTQVGAGGLGDLRGAEQHRGVATPFGVGCATVSTGQAGISVKNDFLAGNTVAFTSSQHQSNCIGLLLVGLSNTDYQGIPLPLDVDPVFGTVGCDLLVSPDLQIPVLANPAGLLVQPFTLLTIRGFVLHCQYAALEAVPGGFSFSNGISVQTPF
jgi:hypothetical protein